MLLAEKITTPIQFSTAPAAWGCGTHSTGWTVHDLLAFRAECCHSATINTFYHRLLGYKLRQLRGRTYRLLLLLLGGICSSWQKCRCTVESKKSSGSLYKSEKYCKSKVQFCLTSLIKFSCQHLAIAEFSWRLGNSDVNCFTGKKFIQTTFLA